MTGAEVFEAFQAYADLIGLPPAADGSTGAFLDPRTAAAWLAWRAAHVALGAYVPPQKGGARG